MTKRTTTPPTIPELRDLLRIYSAAHRFPDDVEAFEGLTGAVEELSDLRQLRVTNDELRRQLAEADAKHERCHAELTKRREQVVALGGEL